MLAAELALALAAEEHVLPELRNLNLHQILFASLEDSGSASGLDFPLISRDEVRRCAVFRWVGTTGIFSPSDMCQRKQRVAWSKGYCLADLGWDLLPPQWCRQGAWPGCFCHSVRLGGRAQPPVPIPAGWLLCSLFYQQVSFWLHGDLTFLLKAKSL